MKSITDLVKFKSLHVRTIVSASLLCLSATASTAYAQNGTLGIPEVLNQLSVAQDKAEALNSQLETLIAAQTTTLSNAIASSTSTLTDNIGELEGLIIGTHLVDPFDVAVDVCAGIGAGASYGAAGDLGIGGEIELKVGINFFGNGVEGKVKPNGAVGGSAGLDANVEVTHSACIAGVFVRQDPLDQEDVAASLTDAVQIAFAEDLRDAGIEFQDRVINTAIGANLYSNSTDKLHMSLDAFEIVTFADDPDVQSLITGGLLGGGSPLSGVINILPIPGGFSTAFGGTFGSGGLATSLGLSPDNICGLVGSDLDGTPIKDACNAVSSVEGAIDAFAGVADVLGFIKDAACVITLNIPDPC